jgi:hypothetical protein
VLVLGALLALGHAGLGAAERGLPARVWRALERVLRRSPRAARAAARSSRRTPPALRAG